MATATMTSKGQITVPAAIRSDLDIHAGDKIQFINGLIFINDKNLSKRKNGN